MGYTRILQYGDTTEIYEYEKNINKKRTAPSALLANRISKDVLPHEKKRNYPKPKTKRELERIQQKAKKYSRSRRSVARSRQNFFRLCHHNNCMAKTIHFLTLTFAYEVEYKQSRRHVYRFMERIAEAYPEISISYISVPELTKKNRWHYHLLVYNLPTETAKRERYTRNFQRQFERGYLDLRHAPNNTEKIAGYMAKYMGKAIANAKTQAERGYTTSRNIEKVTSQGSNQLDTYFDMIIPSDEPTERTEYDVPYLGRCIKTKIVKKL